MEDAEGDVDMVLEEEGAKIEEKERIAKEELEKELRQYRIKVRIKYYPKGRGRLFIHNLHFCVSDRDFSIFVDTSSNQPDSFDINFL